jgi:hypothetical protein
MKSNGLSYLTDKMTGQDLFAHVNLVKGERSYLSELASNLLRLFIKLNHYGKGKGLVYRSPC